MEHQLCRVISVVYKRDAKNKIMKLCIIIKLCIVIVYAHCLNLTLVDAVCEKNSTKVVKNRLVFNFLGTIQFVHNYIESSPMRHSTSEKVAKEQELLS